MSEGEERGKGFKARKREDHALLLIRDLKASLDDLPRARQLLRELGRYYDPILAGGIMDVAHQEQIGQALHLVPGGDADQAGISVAEAAYTYAAGHPGTKTAQRYGRSFTWTCRSCGEHVSDRGLVNGPADDEHGHAAGCPRLAAAITRALARLGEQAACAVRSSGARRLRP